MSIGHEFAIRENRKQIPRNLMTLKYIKKLSQNFGIEIAFKSALQKKNGRRLVITQK